MAAMGLDLMTDSKFLADAKAEFDRRRGGTVYESLNEEKTPEEGRLDLELRSHLECVIHSTMEHFGIKEPVS